VPDEFPLNINNPSGSTTVQTVSYLYNGLEQRVKKTGPTALVASGAAYYVYDEAGHLLGEYDANLAPLQETVYMNETPVALLRQTRTGSATATPPTLNVASNAFYVYSDQTDTPRVITRASDQAIVWRWDAAEPFGLTLPNSNPNALGVFTFNQRFPGQVFDKESNLAQNWHREYQPLTGRYVQSDPIGLAGGINTYSYALSQPNRLVDPEGLQVCVMTPLGPMCTILPPPGGWPNGISYPPKNDPYECILEVALPVPKMPPKPNCESQFQTCMTLARSFPVGGKMLASGGCMLQYLVCKKVLGGDNP
jgi:RHS repeat-associated protein